MLERRANPIGRAATANVPRISLGGMRLAVLDVEQTANFIIDMVFPRRQVGRPLYLTSANGEVLARCSTEPMTGRLFRAADLINADGQPLVTVSRLNSRIPLPERVATTDLFHVVARKAEAAGLTFYMFGADEAENAAAVANVQKMYPDLKIVMIEGGFGWVPQLGWRLDAHWTKMRDEVPDLQRKPSEYLRSNLWYATQPVEEPEHPDDLRKVFEWIGWDRMVYSSDYPHWDFDDPHVAWRFQMTDVEKRQLLHDNALAVYSFK